MSKSPDAARKKRKRGSKWLQQFKFGVLVLAASAFIRVLRLTCRTEIVAGSANLDAALARSAVIPCGWHQQIITSGVFLVDLIPRGLKTGFLISPSRDGEFIARVAKRHGAEIMRGSSSRTGSQALKAIIKGTRQGISPTMYADGPRGPARLFKPGTVILAKRTSTPIMPVGCAASRYWQFNSWDQTRIPKPFARLTIAVGDLWLVSDDKRDVEKIARQVGHRIDELTAVAEKAQ